MLARVRLGGAPPEARHAGHLVLRVTDGDGKKWQADVGFGLGTLFDPIPFGPDPDTVYEQSGWNYRVVEDGSSTSRPAIRSARTSTIRATNSPEPSPT